MLCLLGFSNLQSQNETSQWYFGAKAGLDFLTNPPTIILNSSLPALEGCTSISDADGGILFYTRGDTVYNKNNNVMLNGTGLFGNPSSTQSSLIVKRPGSNHEYFLFTIGLTQGTGLRYSTIDMSLASGNGSVTAKNIPLYTHNPAEKLSGVRHCNGTDVWVMMHDSLNNFRSYLVTNAGVNPSATVSTIGTTYFPANVASIVGHMKFSPNGKKLAVVLSTGSPTIPAKLELYDFDSSTGLLSNLQTLTIAPNAYGCEFSPDGTKLYSGTTGSGNPVLLQWDLCAGSQSAIAASQYTVSTTTGAGVLALQRAVNGKIYSSKTMLGYLGVINKPNASGAACNYVDQGQSVSPGTCKMGLPNILSRGTEFFINYKQDLACSTVSFSPPPSVYTGSMGCSNVVNMPTSYYWLFGDPASGSSNTSTLSYPVHTYPSSGIYSVQLVVAYNSCAPDTFKQTIAVVLPTVNISTATNYCTGVVDATVQVSQGYSNGQYTYTWSPAPTSVTGSFANNLTPGNYTVSVKDVDGSCVSTTTIAITTPTNIMNAIVQTTASCSGGNAQVLANGGSGNFSYLWSPGGSNSPVQFSLTPGIYTVTITDIPNQCSLSQTVLINTLTVPVLTITGNFTICSGNTSTLTASGADTYSWTNSSTSASLSVSPLSTSVYTITGTNSISLCSDTRTVSVTVVPCVGIENFQIDPVIKLFPNPTSGTLYLETDHKISLLLLNLLGEKIIERNLEPGTTRVEFSEFENGLYTIQITYDSVKKYYKVIKRD